MHAFWEITASNSLVALALAAGVALLGRVWKNPAALHVLWVLVLVKLVTPPLLTVPIAFPLDHGRSAGEEPLANPAVGDGPIVAVAEESPPARAGGLDHRTPREEPAPANGAPSMDAAPSATVRQGVSWLTVLGWIWGVGVAVIALAHAVRIARFRRLLRAAQRPPLTVLRMAETIGSRLGLKSMPAIAMLPVRLSPLVWSLDGHARVLLPSALFERLDADAQESILAHELAHVRRKDHWVRLLELGVSTLFWWHPVVWWACHQLRELEEECCDAIVLGTAKRDAKAYAAALMDTLDFLFEGAVAAPLGATAARLSVSMKRRIEMLKNGSRTTRLTVGRLMLLAAVAALPMAVAFAASAPDENNLLLAVGEESNEAPTDLTSGRPAESPAFAPRADEGSKKEPRQALTKSPRETERTIAAALNWLARHQSAEGKWSLSDYHAQCKDATCAGEKPAKTEAGAVKFDAGATALAVLPLLAAGQTHKAKGPYQKALDRGLSWLLKSQAANGDLSQADDSKMISHALATIAICEAYGMTKDKTLAQAGQRAVKFIEQHQDAATGGWRGKPGGGEDTAVFGVQVVALKSAALAGLKVAPKTWAGAKKWLKSVSRGEHGGRFSLRPTNQYSVPITAVGLVCYECLETPPNKAVLEEGVAYLMENRPGSVPRNVYSWCFATQAIHNFFTLAGRPREWDTWNWRLRAELIRMQIHNGCAIGSWDPSGPERALWAGPGRRLIVTSLACLSLEVHYRYLAVFKGDVAHGLHGPRPQPDSRAPGSKPAVQRRAVNRLVKDFPEKSDLSTPESATAALHRAFPKPDPRRWLDPSVWKYTPRDVADIKRKMESQNDERAKAYEAYRNEKILEVLTYRDGLAEVISKVNEGVGRNPYIARLFVRINGAWENFAENWLASLEEARKDFDRVKDNVWEAYLKVLDEIKEGKPVRLEAGDLSSSRPKRSAPVGPGSTPNSAPDQVETSAASLAQAGGGSLPAEAKPGRTHASAREKEDEQVRRETWRIAIQLDTPNLKPPAVQWAVLDKDPLPDFRARVKRMQGFYRSRQELDQSEAWKQEQRLAQTTVYWDKGFQVIGADQLYLLTSVGGHVCASNGPEGKKWIVTKVVWIKRKPVCWRLPVEVKRGRQIKVTLTEGNAFALASALDSAMREGKADVKAEGGGPQVVHRLIDGRSMSFSSPDGPKHFEEVKQLIAQRKYTFVTTFEMPPGKKQYVYRFTCADGFQMGRNFSVPLENVASWDDYLQKDRQQNKRR